MNRFTRPLSLFLLLLTCLLMSGCALGGFIGSVIAGPPKTPPRYQLPNRPTVVLIDDPAHQLPSSNLAPLIAGRIGDMLVEQELVSEVIPASKVEHLRSTRSDFTRWAIDRVGREAGAAQVVYVSIQDFRLTEEGQIYRPVTSARVKVVDAETGKRLFPEKPEEGFPVITQDFYRDLTGATAGTETLTARTLSEHLARDIALLFYEHVKETVTEAAE